MIPRFETAQPLLEGFPFAVPDFHSGNGWDYINKTSCRARLPFLRAPRRI